MSTSRSYGHLTYYDGPLVWIDCEMTGLDYNTDRILEIAVSILSPHEWTFPYLSLGLQVIITNGNLELVDDGIEFVIHTEKAVLDKFDCTLIMCRKESKNVNGSMNDWCIQHHKAVRTLSERIFTSKSIST